MGILDCLPPTSFDGPFDGPLIALFHSVGIYVQHMLEVAVTLVVAAVKCHAVINPARPPLPSAPFN
jgi:hypothetical protein